MKSAIVSVCTKAVFLAGTIILLISCKNGQNNIPDPVNSIAVKVQRIEKVNVAFPIRTSGRLSVESEQKLGFRTGGIIRDVYVKEGQTVKKGQQLAQLNLSEIQAQVTMARAGYEKAKRDFCRAENLYNDSVATLELFQDAKTAMDVAKSDLEIAEFNLKYSRIEAPSNGKILRILMEENEMAAPGYPVILFGSLESQWVVKVNVTDKDVVSINTGDSARLFFDAYPGMLFPGLVNEISGMADPYTGTYEVEIRLVNFNRKKMVTGFIAKAEIIPDKKQGLIAIPVDAVFNSSETSGYVYEIVDSSATLHKIKFERIGGDKVYISEGINPGTYVVTEGMNFIGEDSKIIIDSL